MTEKQHFEDLVELDYRAFLPFINEEATEYDKALEFALDSDAKICNVAITGPYGAGKSSVFDSYLKRSGRSDDDIIRISLAKTHLDEMGSEIIETGEDENPDGSVLPKNNLEAEIISQLAAQLDSSKIPLSGFKRIDIPSEAKREQTLFYVRALLAAVAALAFVTLDNAFDFSPQFWSISLAFLIVVCGILIYKIVETSIGKSVLTKLFKKVKFFDAEIELFESKSASINKHLDEVLYILEASNKNIVVFEDLDRYGNPNIYSTLRNLCFLFNERLCSQKENPVVNKAIARKSFNVPWKRHEAEGDEQVPHAEESLLPSRKTVKFVYMVRDDLFDQGDRTKYFDFIIPVVPFLDGSNTAEFISKEVESLSRHPKCRIIFEQSGLFIEDARTLYGIMNEFKVYNAILQDRLALPQEKILAIVVYKNLFPKDFALLQYGGGFLGSLLNNADRLRRNQLDLIEGQIDALDDEIQELKDLLLRDVTILEGSFVNIPGSYYLDNSHSSSHNLSGIGYITAVVEGRVKNSSSQEVSREDIKEELKGNSDYSKQARTINKLAAGRLEVLENEKADKIRQIELEQSKSISQMLIESPELFDGLVSHIGETGECDTETFDAIQTSKKKSLIRIYLENGYIDEYYRNYLSPFFGSSPSDRNFLLSLINEENPMGYAFEINSTDYIINSISPVYFLNRKSTLNFDLLDALLEKPRKYSALIDNLLSQVISGKSEDFITGYIESNSFKPIFINELFSRYENLFTILMDWQTSEKSLAQIIHETLHYYPDRVTKAPDAELIASFAGKSEEFAKSVNEEDITLLAQIDVEFREGPLIRIPKKAMDALINNNLFYPSPECFKCVLDYCKSKGKRLDQSVNRICYSDIIEAAKEGISDYLEDNLDRFICSYLEPTDLTLNTDSEDSAIHILNNLIDSDLKLSYLKSLSYEIGQLDSIEDREYWKVILELSKVRCTLENALSYYLYSENEESLGIPEELLDFISENNYADSKLTSDNLYFNDFSVDLLASSLSDKMILPFLLSAHTPIELPGDEQYTGVIENRLDMLVENGLIEISEHHLQLLSQYNEGLIGELAQSNFEDYIETLSQGWEASEWEIESVIEGEHHIAQKKRVLELTSLPIRLSSNISSDLYNTIIYDHFNKEDFPFLIKLYGTFESETQKAALYQILSHKKEILESSQDMPSMLLMDIASTCNTENAWDRASIKTLLVKAAQYVNKQTLIDGFSAQNLYREARCLKGYQESFEDTEQNRDFLQKLVNRNFISSFRADWHCSGNLRSIPKRRN